MPKKFLARKSNFTTDINDNVTVEETSKGLNIYL